MCCTVHCLVSNADELQALIEGIADAGIADGRVHVVWRDLDGAAAGGREGAPGRVAAARHAARGTGNAACEARAGKGALAPGPHPAPTRPYRAEEKKP